MAIFNWIKENNNEPQKINTNKQVLEKIYSLHNYNHQYTYSKEVQNDRELRGNQIQEKKDLRNLTLLNLSAFRIKKIKQNKTELFP